MKSPLILLTCAAIEKALALVIRQSGVSFSQQANLQNKVLCVQLAELTWPIYFIFNKKILVLSHYEDKVDSEVKTDLGTLYQISDGASLTELIKQDKLEIIGDLKLLQHFSGYMHQIEFDIGEPLSRYFGDAAAHLIVTKASYFGQSVQQKFHHHKQHLGEIITEEIQVAAHRLQYRQYRRQVDEISVATEALESRLLRLQARVSP